MSESDFPSSKQGRDDSLPAVLRRRYKALREDGYNHEFCNVFKRAADALERAADEPSARLARAEALMQEIQDEISFDDNKCPMLGDDVFEFLQRKDGDVQPPSAGLVELRDYLAKELRDTRGVHQGYIDLAELVHDRIVRIIASGATVPPGASELAEWRRLKTDRHAAHMACLRGVVALSADDALHVGGTSRNELDQLRALRDAQPPGARKPQWYTVHGVLTKISENGCIEGPLLDIRPGSVHEVYRKDEVDQLLRASQPPRAAYAVCGLHVDQWQADCNACKSAQAERAGATVPPLSNPHAKYLRKLEQHLRGDKAHGYANTVEQAADEIDCLQAENTALRNLAENLRPGPISEALAGALADEPSGEPAGYRLDYTAGTVEAFHLTTPGSLQLDIKGLREDGRTNIRATPLYRHTEPPSASRGREPTLRVAMAQVLNWFDEGGQYGEEFVAFVRGIVGPETKPAAPYVMKPSEEAAMFKAVTKRPVETSACEHLRRVGELTPEGKVINVQCEACGAALSETDA